MVGIVSFIYGIIKILGYFTKDMFQLAFQFELEQSSIVAIVGLLNLWVIQNIVKIIRSNDI